MLGTAVETCDARLSPPLRGRGGEGGTTNIRVCGFPPSLTLPQRKSGLPDLRQINMRNRGGPRLRGGGNGKSKPSHDEINCCGEWA
jgi:hypothetical protein